MVDWSHVYEVLATETDHIEQQKGPKVVDIGRQEEGSEGDYLAK